MNGTNESHENPGSKLNFFRKNLKILCHPICNRLYVCENIRAGGWMCGCLCVGVCVRARRCVSTSVCLSFWTPPPSPPGTLPPSEKRDYNSILMVPRFISGDILLMVCWWSHFTSRRKVHVDGPMSEVVEKFIWWSRFKSGGNVLMEIFWWSRQLSEGGVVRFVTRSGQKPGFWTVTTVLEFVKFETKVRGFTLYVHVCVCVRITLVYNPLYKQCTQLDLCRYHTRLDVWPYLTHPYIYIYIYIYIYVYICTYISTCVQGIIARRYTACSWKDETRNCRRNGKQNLDGHRTSLFTRCILKETWTWKETWTLTIEDFDFYSDDHFDGQSSGLCSSSGLF